MKDGSIQSLDGEKEQFSTHYTSIEEIDKRELSKGSLMEQDLPNSLVQISEGIFVSY